MADGSPPRFTEQMTMHLNGGSKFSELHFRIYADGRETKITRHRRTSGSPRYFITDDFFACGEERFDNRAAGGVGLMEWLVAHSAAPEAGLDVPTSGEPTARA